MQESSFSLGLRYVIAALSLYDEYSNDILDMPEGTCFPRFCSAPICSSLWLQSIFLPCVFTHLIFDRLQYRKKADSSQKASESTSISRPGSLRKAPSRSSSMKNGIAELKSFEVFFVLILHLDADVAFVPWIYLMKYCSWCVAVGCVIQGMFPCWRKNDFWRCNYRKRHRRSQIW